MASCYICDRILDGGRGYWIPNQQSKCNIDILVCTECYHKWKDEHHDSD